MPLICFPIDCFRDGSGLNALKIKNCLNEVSFFNLAGRPETDCIKTITGGLLLVPFSWPRKKMNRGLGQRPIVN